MFGTVCCTMVPGLSRGKSCQGLALNTHNIAAPGTSVGTVLPLPSLSACLAYYRTAFTFTPYSLWVGTYLLENKLQKGKFVPVHAMKAYMGNRGTAPLILNLLLDGGEWSTPGPPRFTLGKERRYPLNRQLGGPQSRSAHFGEKK